METAAGNGFRKGEDIATRLLELAAKVVALVRTLPKDGLGRHVAAQLFRCCTSGGANYEEARAAESPSDFIHKISLASKEIRETIYWLRLIQQSSMSTMPVDGVLREANELAAILVASGRTARRNLQR